VIDRDAATPPPYAQVLALGLRWVICDVRRKVWHARDIGLHRHETDFHRLCSIGDSSFTRSLCPRLNPSGQRSRFRDAVDRLSRAARRKFNSRTL